MCGSIRCGSARKLLILLFIAFVSACSDGNGGSSSDEAAAANDQSHQAIITDAGSEAAPNTTAVEGSVVKGILSNALVRVYSLDLQGRVLEELASGFTDDNGYYQLFIPDDYVGFIEVLVSANSSVGAPTRMVCDGIEGCGLFPLGDPLDVNGDGVINFGERFAIDDSFQLSTVTMALGDGNPFSASVTPFTDLAGALAKSFADGLNEENLHIARSQVANLFGLSELFAELRAIDISDSNGLAEVNYDLLNYSIMTASLAGLIDGNNSIGEILAQLRTEFIANNGQLLENSNDLGPLSLNQILSSAMDISNGLSASGDSIDEIRSRIAQRLSKTLQADAGELTEGQSSPTVNSDQLVQIKSFTSELKAWSGSIDLDNLDELAFSEEFQLAQQTFAPIEMLAALAAVGKYAAVLAAVPDVANNEDVLPLLCSYLEGAIAQLCSGIAEQYTLAELCADDFTLLGINACGMVSQYLEITVPTLEPDLVVKVNVLTRELTAQGTVRDQQVDFVFTVPDLYSQELVYADISGTIVGAEANLLVEGEISLDKMGGLDDLELTELAQQVDENSISGQIFVVTENSSGFDGSLSIVLGETPELALSIETLSQTGDDAVITFVGEMDGLSLDQTDLLVAYGGHEIEINRDPQEQLLTLSNQDGVELEIYLDVAGDGQLGALFHRGELFGTVVRDGLNVELQYVDGESSDLSDLF